jgi:hypothetical protein
MRFASALSGLFCAVIVAVDDVSWAASWLHPQELCSITEYGTENPTDYARNSQESSNVGQLDFRLYMDVFHANNAGR